MDDAEFKLIERLLSAPTLTVAEARAELGLPDPDAGEPARPEPKAAA